MIIESEKLSGALEDAQVDIGKCGATAFWTRSECIHGNSVLDLEGRVEAVQL